MAVIGCSTYGKIVGQEIHDEIISVTVVEFSRTTVQLASTNIQSSMDSYSAGEKIGQQLMSPELQGIFILSDGLLINGSELAKGMDSVLPEHVVVTGGLAGDGSRFQQTWVVQDGQAKSGYVTAVGFYGDAVRIGHGSKGDWDVLDLERRIPQSERNVRSMRTSQSNHDAHCNF